MKGMSINNQIVSWKHELAWENGWTSKSNVNGAIINFVFAIVVCIIWRE